LSANLNGGPALERILIVRLSAMGDVVHALPAVQALRGAFPHAKIGWLIEERWAELLCVPGASRCGPRSAQRPLVDCVHTVDLKGWRKSLFSIPTLERIARVWNDVQAEWYGVAIDLQGAIRSAVLARWSGAPVVIGAREAREAPAGLWYTRQATSRGAHVIEHGVSVVESVTGMKLRAPGVEFPRDPQVEARISQRLTDAGIHEFAILNPGAGWGAKKWPAERYGQVARGMASGGVQSIVNYGPGEQELAREVEAASGGAARAFQCSISELIALTRRAKLFIGGDTGPMHLAAAMRVPVVAIFGPTDPVRNGPYGTPSTVLRNPASATTHARNQKPDGAMLAIRVEDVANAARSLLTRECAEAVRG
jgi:heptosyltransferase-1